MFNRFFTALVAVLIVNFLASCGRSPGTGSPSAAKPVVSGEMTATPSGTADEGGGGGFTESYFFAAAREVFDHFNRFKVLPEKHDELDELVNKGKLTVTLSEIELRHPQKGRVDALNFPDKRTITLYHATWKSMAEKKLDIRLLVCHELSGILGVEDNHYELCSRYFPLNGISPFPDATKFYCVLEVFSFKGDPTTNPSSGEQRFIEKTFDMKSQELDGDEARFSSLTKMLKTKLGGGIIAINEKIRLKVNGELNTPANGDSSLSVSFQLASGSASNLLQVGASKHSNFDFARFQYLNPKLISFIENELGYSGMKLNPAAVPMTLFAGFAKTPRAKEVWEKNKLVEEIISVGAFCRANLD